MITQHKRKLILNAPISKLFYRPLDVCWPWSINRLRNKNKRLRRLLFVITRILKKITVEKNVNYAYQSLLLANLKNWDTF